MLLRSAAQKDSSDVVRAQDDSVRKNGRSVNFQGRQTTVSARAGFSSSASGAALTANQRKRQITTIDSLSEAVTILFRDRCRFKLDKRSPYYLNNDFSRLLIKNCDGTGTDIWLANSSGTFVKEATITMDLPMQGISQHRADILFVPCSTANHGHILTVYERDNIEGYKKTQELSSFDLLNQHRTDFNSDVWTPDYISRLVLSDDGTSVACLTGRQVVILGRGPDNKWVNKGNCMEADKLIFSKDCNHVAMTWADRLSLMSKGADGVWTQTGRMDDDIGMWKMAFSPDSRHFMTWFTEDAQEGYQDFDFRCDFFVALFALSPDNQWVEKTRITKYAPSPTEFYPLRASFSPDGKHLVVCGQDTFDIWDLDNDGNWTSVIENIPYIKRDSIEGIKKPVIHFATNSDRFMLLGQANGVVWGLQDNGLWNCQHAFAVDWGLRPQFSADGKAIICQDPTDSGERGLWLEDASGNWVWQTIVFDFDKPLFHPVHSLLVLNGPTRNTLMFSGPGSDKHASWEEKGCLQLAGNVKFYDFSADGRSLKVIYSVDDDQVVVSIWEIVVNNSNIGLKRNRYDLRQREVK